MNDIYFVKTPVHNMLSLIFLTTFISGVISEESWVVNTEYGDVRGYWSEEHQVWEFLGIPYAAPPVGDLRFKAPVAPEPWSDVFNATEIKSVCMQADKYSNGLESEDCLIINVYVPETARTGNILPILYFAHGGGFDYGSSKDYNPYHTTRHDVILVTFNYRLGAFGYLCMGTDLVPGNAGFKDHIATLKWTNTNIANFGGDPNSVTIYGESAGASNVETLIYSPVTEGLFNRAIIESGSALTSGSYCRDRYGVASAIALNLNCTNVDDPEKLGECLMEAPADQLNLVQLNYDHSLCIENEVEGVEKAVTGDPYEIVQNKNYNMVPILYAFTELEGAAFNSYFESHMASFYNNSYDDYFIPSNIDLTSEETFQVNNELKKFYFNTTSVDSMLDFIIFYTDLKFVNAIFRSILQNFKNGNTVYLLKYSYNGGFNRDSYYAKLYDSASHASIVANIMDLGYYNNETLEADQVIRDRMTEIWTNFVKYGSPLINGSMSVEWPPFTEEEQYYFLMDEEVSVNILENQDRLQYWDELYKSYYYPAPVFGAGVQTASFSILISFCVIFVLLNYLN